MKGQEVRTPVMRSGSSAESGAISVMAAILVVVMVLATSLAVDVGRVAASSRDQQGATDRAALDAARLLLNPPADATSCQTLLPHVAAQAEDTLALNGFSEDQQDDWTTAVALGHVPEGTTDFFELCPTRDPSVDTFAEHPANAVRVETGARQGLLFALGISDGRDIDKTSVAVAGGPLAALSAASTTLRLGDGLVQSMLGIAGVDAGIDLVGYEGVLRTGISLGTIAHELDVGTTSGLLDTSLTVGQWTALIVRALQASEELDSTEEAQVQDLLLDLGGVEYGADLPPVRFGDLVKVDPTAGTAALESVVDAGGLISALAQVANHQHAVALDLNVAGLAAQLRVIEPPQIAIGPPGKDSHGQYRTVAKTAQVRLDVTLPLGSALGGDVLSAPSVDDDAAYAAAQDFRNDINAISDCEDALEEAEDKPGTIRQQLDRAIENVEQEAAEADLLTETVTGLLGTANGLLGGLTNLVDGLLGLLGLGSCSTSDMDEAKADLLALADVYGDLLESVGGDVGTTTTASGVAPVLSVRVGQGQHALADIDCADPLVVTTRLGGRAARVMITSTDQVDDPGNQPTPVPMKLVDVDLGLLGTVGVTIELDTAIGEHALDDPDIEDTTFSFPPQTFPSEPKSAWSGELGMGSVMSGVVVQPQVGVLGVDVGSHLSDTVQLVGNAIGPVLETVDTGLLSPLLDTVGIQLGVVDGRVLSASCDSSVSLLPLPLR